MSIGITYLQRKPCNSIFRTWPNLYERPARVAVSVLLASEVFLVGRLSLTLLRMSAPHLYSSRTPFQFHGGLVEAGATRPPQGLLSSSWSSSGSMC